MFPHNEKSLGEGFSFLGVNPCFVLNFSNSQGGFTCGDGVVNYRQNHNAD